VAGLKNDMVAVNTAVAGLKNSVDTNTTKLGQIQESSLRSVIEKQFGYPFAKSMTYVSLENIVSFVLKSNATEPQTINIEERKFMTMKVIRELANKKVPEAYARTLLLGWCSLSKANRVEAEKIFGEDWSVTVASEWKHFLILITDSSAGSLCRFDEGEQKSFIARCVMLKNYFCSTTEDRGLLSCKSCGISLAVFASIVGMDKSVLCKSFEDIQAKLGEFGIQDGKPWNISNEIEMDCRGTISFVGSYCTITCGEIKSSQTLVAKGKKQLRLRISTLKRIIGIMNPNVENWICVAYLFLSHGAKKANQNQDQIDDDGVSFRIVYL
jgi:hypothetical protein